MSVKEYLETTAVFSIDEFKETFPTVTGYNLLMRAVKAGKVKRVSRGLYASATGRFAGEKHDRFKIASNLADDVVFSYHSALELFGVAHSVSSQIQYYSETNRKEIVFQDNSFKQYPANREAVMVQTVRANAYGAVVVTTKEQTLLDCLSNLGRGGGAEEVLRSISGFPYIDVSVIKDRAARLNVSAIARIGWTIEQKREMWGVTEKDLNDFQNMLSGNVHRFVSGGSAEAGWSNRWKLVLPTAEEEMKEWIL